MPTIQRKPIKEKKIKYKRESKINAQEHYNSPAWKLMRKTWISQHPLCQICLSKERVVPAEEVHHKHFWSSGETEEEQWKLFLDWNNLQSVCSSCHHKIHNKARKHGLIFCDDLTDKEYNDDEIF